MARVTTCKGGRWQERPPVGAAPARVALLAREVPPEGSSAYRSGCCPCRRLAAPLSAQGSGDDSSTDGDIERARASF
ncbi:hypothetical protein B296_00051368 [Ensete ventricosum]|uniref:Uncharacterized protein n=1 Tax=Ensete ventricosum TaxID=4639 RepID=A0A426WWE3_ENSVE|nr:hypothetical protein B296_00051368 [Ensete ventricosum]